MKAHSIKAIASAKAFWVLILVFTISGLGAQTSKQSHRRVPLPQDWTHRHVIFSRAALRAYPALANAEPRALHQWVRQNAKARPALRAGDDAGSDGMQRDWNVSLGAGRVAAGMSPAKFGFDVTAAPSCANDYVVFGVNVAGSGTQANLIAFNNLYSGTGGLCGSGAPSVLFAYNVSTIGGRIATSPILSLDGTKIGFVETTGTGAVLHILTWQTGVGNGTSATAPAVPGAGNTASMVNITLGNAAVTRSSPWIDYNTDTVYVGNNNGRMFKVINVFNGVPALAGAPWPVTLTPNRILTGPVLDNISKKIFVGNSNGVLMAFDSVTGGSLQTLAVGAPGLLGSNILDPPIVDPTNGVVYAVSANDGTSAVLVEASTSNLAQLARARIGMGSFGTTVNVPLYDGSPDNNYFNDPSTGSFLVCGTASNSTAPALYTLTFTGTVLNTPPPAPEQLLTSTRSRCSPITEFFNDNVGGGTDFFFFGLSFDCFGTNTRGCIVSRQTPGTPPTPLAETGGTSAIVIDNQSTEGQASSIYFGNINAPGLAVKVTQSGLR